jgi:hypothetical protein
VIALAALAAIQAISCPAVLRDHPLTTVQVFDGNPKEQADLEPDAGGWDLKAIRPTSSPEGFFLVCGYKGTKDQVTLRLPHETDFCRRSGPIRAPKVSCR